METINDSQRGVFRNNETSRVVPNYPLELQRGAEVAEHLPEEVISGVSSMGPNYPYLYR